MAFQRSGDVGSIFIEPNDNCRMAQQRLGTGFVLQPARDLVREARLPCASWPNDLDRTPMRAEVRRKRFRPWLCDQVPETADPDRQWNESGSSRHHWQSIKGGLCLRSILSYPCVENPTVLRKQSNSSDVKIICTGLGSQFEKFSAWLSIS